MMKLMCSKSKAHKHRFPIPFLQTLQKLVTPSMGFSVSPRSCSPSPPCHNEPGGPSGTADDAGSIPCFGYPISSRAVVYDRHCLFCFTLPFTNNVDRFYILALFSAVEKSHCVRM